MIWRESLPARVAMATAGLLTVILLTISASAYVITALLLRQAVDSTLAARVALPEQRPGWDRDNEDWEHIIPFDDKHMPPPGRDGQVFVSLVEEHGEWVPRTGPDWWQALTPADDEVRVLYGRSRGGGETWRAFASMEAAHEVLPALLRWLILISIVGVLLSALIAWRMAGQTYKPLRAVIATTEEIHAQSLELRVPDTWHDRTLRKLTQVLNAMISRLQAAFEAQGRFVASAAHELRGPLGAMRAELEVALRRPRSPEEYREALEGALAETSRLSSLAEHLLTLSRGAAMSREAGIPVPSLLERVATEVRRATGGEVETASPPDLTVDGDSLALERLVSNLARNGVEAGGAPVRIEARPVRGGVELTVADNGRGIPAESLPMIFEPFYRADPARSRDGGTGLGLAIVKTIVDAHRGTVRVESELDRGTTFTIWLPTVSAGE
ncbi:MAG: signal transduction histidine kinase [Symbiobacteriaceae bacterium]|jgi:signal transduction histidine kinase|nr:signal transduction histidine kinase [Symbiobacteriaceae bacterium]